MCKIALTVQEINTFGTVLWALNISIYQEWAFCENWESLSHNKYTHCGRFEGRSVQGRVQQKCALDPIALFQLKSVPSSLRIYASKIGPSLIDLLRWSARLCLKKGEMYMTSISPVLTHLLFLLVIFFSR